MFTRPKPSETEEDLLRLQEEFLRHKQISKEPNAPSSTECQTTINAGNDNNPETRIDDQLANTFETIPNLCLGAIKEKLEADVKNGPVLANAPKTGFPKAQKFGGISRFGRKRKEMQDATVNKRSQPTISYQQPEIMQIDHTSLYQMKEEVHRQNSNILAGMTLEEIKAEQEKYMNSLDPALIAFIKSRKKAQSELPQPQTITSAMDTASQIPSEDDVKLEQIEIPMQIANDATDNHWIGFDKVEVDKLSWMKDIEIHKTLKNKDFDARFDFQGWLLPYKFKEIDETTRALYHHGEEADRPGYTLQELFQLSRSTVPQQRIIALNCIANILRINSLGIYKDVIDIPLEQIFFVLRFCLDDNTPAVLNASIKAMRNLIHCYTDEVGLDITLLYGFGKIQPIISVDDKDEDDFTENDQQVIEKNFIKCLVRTNILNRIRYIIDTVKPPLEDAHYCMDILIRLARDSKFVYEKIIKCDGLIKSIVDNYLPTERKDYNIVLVEALKLFRVLICREKHLANNLIQRYHIIESIEGYLSNEIFYSNIEGLMIQIECFNICSSLIHYRLACEDLRRLQPIFLRLLAYHVNVLDLNQQRSFVVFNHVAAFFNLLSEVFVVEHAGHQSYIPLITLCLQKWTSQLLNANKSNLTAVSALLNCVANYISRSCDSQLNQIVCKLLLHIVKSQKFNTVTKNVVKDSILMNKCEVNTTSVNLKTLESGAWGSPEHVIPILQIKNCIPFLLALSNLLLASKNQDVTRNFLASENLKIYIEALLMSNQFYNINNWFMQVEGIFIINLLKLSCTIGNCEDWTKIYSLAIKTLPAFNVRQKEDVVFIFKNIIFNPSILNKVIMSGEELLPQDLLNSTKDMLKVYLDILDLDKTVLNFENSLSLDVKLGNIVPVDWLYSPIVAIYSKNQENVKIAEEIQLHQLKNCLKWILFSESFLPPISDAIRVTEKYCRIACVFLAHDSLFLDPEVHNVLEKLLEGLMPFSDQINFSEKIQGVASFEDFYKLLLEQYQGVSYGDRLFANVVLVPLAQRHDVKWRKILWSEYLGTVEAMYITQEQVMFNINGLLDPPEEDKSLLICYKRALNTNVLRKNSILYKVALHHVMSFVERNKNP